MRDAALEAAFRAGWEAGRRHTADEITGHLERAGLVYLRPEWGGEVRLSAAAAAALGRVLDSEPEAFDSERLRAALDACREAPERISWARAPRGWIAVDNLTGEVLRVELDAA